MTVTKKRKLRLESFDLKVEILPKKNKWRFV